MPKDEHVETSRVEAFSDGVFALAITLLVLDLHPPESGDLWTGLIHEWPQFAAYLTSFVVIGIMWANHHSMFRRIVRSDRVLLFLNLVLLLWTSLLPFPTGLVARYLGAGGLNASVAEALYSANLTLAALAFSLVWFRAVHGNRLVDAQLTPRQQWATLARFSHLVLRRGAKGPAVRYVQHHVGVPADGVYGRRTKAAVRTFQAHHHLVADGVVGRCTWRALIR